MLLRQLFKAVNMIGMSETIEVLKRTMLFQGIDDRGIGELLVCLNARHAEYKAGEIIIWEGDAVTDIGIVLSGRAQSDKTDASGRAAILTLLESGSFIGIFLAAGHHRESPVNVRACERLSVLYIPFASVTARCAKSCTMHDILLRNCFDSIAYKSLLLHDRLDCLLRRTLREKIMVFLSQQAERAMVGEGRVFTVPLNRSAMAEYINTDRSALSRELSKMKGEGLIDYYKNSFKLRRV